MFQEPILKDLVYCSQSCEVGIFTIPLLHVKAQIREVNLELEYQQSI